MTDVWRVNYNDEGNSTDWIVENVDTLAWYTVHPNTYYAAVEEAQRRNATAVKADEVKRYFVARADCPDAYLYDGQEFGPTVLYSGGTGFKPVVVTGFDAANALFRAEYLRGRINSGMYCRFDCPIFDSMEGAIIEALHLAEFYKPVDSSVRGR